MNNPKKLTLWLQALIILLCWTSPFWLSWKFILTGIFVYYLQLVFFNEDFLTRKNFGTKERGEMTFYSFILEKIGIKFNRRKVQLAADFIFPWLILLAGLYWQKII